MNTQTILQHYLMAAIFADAPEEFSGECYGISLTDFSPETVKQAKADVESFVKLNKDLLIESGLSYEQIGHDFWLTRNGHGAGFWDGGLGEVGEELSDAINDQFKEVNLYRMENGVYEIGL